jgi:hypothetical protein
MFSHFWLLRYCWICAIRFVLKKTHKVIVFKNINILEFCTFCAIWFGTIISVMNETDTKKLINKNIWKFLNDFRFEYEAITYCELSSLSAAITSWRDDVKSCTTGGRSSVGDRFSVVVINAGLQRYCSWTKFSFLFRIGLR